MTKVALTGASGGMGSALRPELLKRGIDLRSVGGRRPLEPIVPGEDVMSGDLRDPAVVDRVLKDVDVLIHLAGTSVERPLPEIIDNNLTALYEVYEGCRRQGVRRVVFASSNHVIGCHSVDSKLKVDCEMRPDCFYGLSKMWGEGMTRMYWDKHGIEGISVRIGSCFERPTDLRQLSTYFAYEDMVQFMMQCITVPEVGYMVVWGVSNNDRSYWDNTEPAERLGYKPVHNSEKFAAEILAKPNPLSPTAQKYQGGAFVTLDYTEPEQRPGASKPPNPLRSIDG